MLANIYFKLRAHCDVSGRNDVHWLPEQLSRLKLKVYSKPFGCKRKYCSNQKKTKKLSKFL